MLTHEQRILANLYADRIVATNRWYAIKRKLCDQREARMKLTKKREPHVGNKVPILVAHAQEEGRCIDRLADALKIARQDLRAIEAACNVDAEWANRAAQQAKRILADDKTRGCCGCHLCAARKDDVRWMRGR